MNKKQKIYRENTKSEKNSALIMLAVILVICMTVSFMIGHYQVPIRQLFGIITSKLGIPIEKTWSAQMEIAVWNIRFPRILLSVMVGASLAAAGAGFQGVFQNPMASPDILGASAGAGFGAALAILVGLNGLGITLTAFVMSIITVVFVFSVGRYVKGDKLVGLVLSGIIVSSLFQAGTSYIKLVADPGNKLPQITYWLMGSLAGASWREVKTAIIPFCIGTTTLLLLRWRINVLTMGDDEARALGINAPRLRTGIIVASTLLTASAISVSGMIGWVGLVIPHMMRRVVGSDYRHLMGSSILSGGIFLLVVDNISRNVSESGIPIGILTAFIGAPFFIWLITGRVDHYET